MKNRIYFENVENTCKKIFLNMSTRTDSEIKQLMTNFDFSTIPNGKCVFVNSMDEISPAVIKFIVDLQVDMVTSIVQITGDDCEVFTFYKYMQKYKKYTLDLISELTDPEHVVCIDDESKSIYRPLKISSMFGW